MKERPILFQGAMVRAILAGTNTQTRRVAKEFGEQHAGILKNYPNQHGCPYGEPGDRLWVREAWAPEQYDQLAESVAELEATLNKPAYKADWDATPTRLPAYLWKPSIHMPRRLCRLELEITGVRVERLQDISETDARAEGIVQFNDGHGWHTEDGRHYMGKPQDSYASLWESINGPGSWDANPWVWVVEFKRAEASQ